MNLINFKSLGDARGELVALEGHRNVPFDIKRVYYISGTESGVSRGFHAHKNLQQVAICISGSCRMVIDDGNNKESVLLNSPFKGVLISSMLWREMHEFTSDCILLVLASDYYDESDYIRDYGEFLEIVNG